MEIFFGCISYSTGPIISTIIPAAVFESAKFKEDQLKMAGNQRDSEVRELFVIQMIVITHKIALGGGERPPLLQMKGLRHRS